MTSLLSLRGKLFKSCLYNLFTAFPFPIIPWSHSDQFCFPDFPLKKKKKLFVHVVWCGMTWRMRVTDQRTIRVFLCCSPPYFPARTLTDISARLPGPDPRNPPVHWNCKHTFFDVGVGDPTQVPILKQQMLCPLTHLPCPSTEIFQEFTDILNFAKAND